MIFRTTMPGNWTDELEPYYEYAAAFTVSETTPHRYSAILGLDGEPLRIDLPRRRAGFVLPHEGK